MEKQKKACTDDAHNADDITSSTTDPRAENFFISQERYSN
jgi:hypothetical protein